MGTKKTTKTKTTAGKGRKGAKAEDPQDMAPATPAAGPTPVDRAAAEQPVAAETPEAADSPAPAQTADGAPPAAKGRTKTRAASAVRGTGAPERKLSQLDAAARVLAEEGRPMTCKEMVEVMATRGYWSSPKGKTPQATLYSAILREMTAKGERSRFAKADRGTFARTATA
jgi:hypothetical protein